MLQQQSDKKLKKDPEIVHSGHNQRFRSLTVYHKADSEYKHMKNLIL